MHQAADAPVQLQIEAVVQAVPLDAQLQVVVVQDQVLLSDLIHVQDQTPAQDQVGTVPAVPEVQHPAGRVCKRKRGRSFKLKPPVYAPIGREKLTVAISKIRSRLIRFKDFDKKDLSILFWSESAPNQIENQENQDTIHIDEEDNTHTISGTCQVDDDQDKMKIVPGSESQDDQPEEVKPGNKYMLGLRQLNTRYSDPKIIMKGRRKSSKITSRDSKSNKIVTPPSVVAESFKAVRDIRSYFSGKVDNTHEGGKVKRAAEGDITQTRKWKDKITGD